MAARARRAHRQRRFMHIALANYWLVGITGPKPPVELNPRLEKTVTRKAQVIEWLKGSLEFVKTKKGAAQTRRSGTRREGGEP